MSLYSLLKSKRDIYLARIKEFEFSKLQCSDEADPIQKHYPHLERSKRCVVPNCPNKYYRILNKSIDFENIRFARFPLGIKRRTEWIESIEKGTGLEVRHLISHNSVICIQHFDQSCLFPSQIVSDAVPTLFTRESPKAQTKTIDNVDNPADHETLDNSVNETSCTSDNSCSFDRVENNTIIDRTIKSPISSNLNIPLTNIDDSKPHQLKISDPNDILQLLDAKSQKNGCKNEYYVLEVDDRFESEVLPINEHQGTISTLEDTSDLASDNDLRENVNEEPKYLPGNYSYYNVFLDHDYNVSRTNSPDTISCTSDWSSDSSISFSLSPLSISEKIIKYRYLKKKKRRKQIEKLKDKIKFKMLERKIGKIYYWSFKDNIIECQVGYRKDKIRVLHRKDLFHLARSGTKPSSFKELKDSLIMPYDSTLKALLNNLPLKSGINSLVFTRLSKKVKRDNRVCVLLFGIIKLVSKIKNCRLDDKNIGCENFKRLGKPAAAVVFIIQDVKKSWKQPVAYYLVDSLTVGALSNAIIEVVTNLQEIKYLVVGTVCNYTSINKKTLSALCRKDDINNNNPYFSVNKQKIFTLYDPLSLLVNTRIALFNCDIEYEPGKFAKYKNLIDSYNLDKKRRFPKLANVRPKDLLSKKCPGSSRINVAVKTFSKALASCIDVGLGVEGTNTAKFLCEIDKMFKYFYLRNNRRKHTSRQRLQWKKWIQFIKKWLFHNRINGCVKPFVTLKNAWITTIKAKERLCTVFKAEPLNLDSFHNCLTCIYFLSAGNRKPTANEFVAGYKLSLLNNLIVPRSTKTNFRKDKGIILDNYRECLKSRETTLALENSEEFDRFSKLESDFELQVIDISREIEVTFEMFKFILENLKLGFCDLCKSSIIIDSTLFECLKEDDEQIPFLVTNDFSLFISNIYHRIMYILEKFGYFQNIKSKLKLYLVKNVNFGWFKCPEHREIVSSKLLDLSIIMLIKKYMKT